MFNIQAYLYRLLSILTTALGDKYEASKPRIEEIMADTEKGLRHLAQSVLDGKIEIKDIPTFAEQHFYVLKTELLETAVIGVSFTETTINGAIEEAVSILKEITEPKERA